MATGIERNFRIASALVLVLFIGVGAMVYQSTKRLVNINNLVEHTQEVLLKLEALQSTLDEAVSSTRNYVVSGDESNLDRFAHAKTNLTELVRLIHSLTADNPAQQRRILELEPQLVSTYQYWGDAVTKRRRGESDAADRLMSSARALQLMRENRRIIVTMIQEEDQLLESRSREARASARRAIVIETVLAIAALAILAVAYLFVQMDMNKKAKALQALRQSEKSYRRLVELSPDAMWVHRQGTIVFANSACVALFGASSADELLGKHLLDFVHPDDREAVKQRIQKLYDGKPVPRNESKLTRLDGTEIYAEVVPCPVSYQGQVAAQVTLRDISERKQTEQKLRQTEANLVAAQAIAHVGNWSWDIIDDVLSWSAEMFRIYGVSPEEFDSKVASLASLIHPEDVWRHEKCIVDMLAGKPFEDFEYRVVRPDGSERVVQVLGGALDRDVTGLPVRMSGVVLDITERKKAEERFHKAFNAIPEPMTIATVSEGRYIDVNEGFLRVTGYRREEVIGRTSLELNFWKRQEDRARLVEILEKQGSVRDLEITFHTKSGEQRTGLDSASVIEVAGESRALCAKKQACIRRIESCRSQPSIPSRESSLRNLEKARANWRPPRPWRSSRETHVIRRLVWQWLDYRGPGKWPGRAVARRIGVTHTYIQKLLREFSENPNRIVREQRLYGPATFEHLERAQEETRQQKERGWLRSPCRWKVAEFEAGAQVVRAVVPTKAGTLPPAAFGRIRHDVPCWARGIPYYSADNPCDPLVAVKHAVEESRRPRPVRFTRRWRPGMPFTY